MVKTKNETYSLCKKVPLVLPDKLARQIDNQINIPESYYASLRKKLTGSIPDKEVYKRLSNVHSLVIELTHGCNLRCAYCAYSGIYKSRRLHQSKKMPFTTAKRAVDFFFNQVKSPLRTTRKTPLVSFYGGEPLLEFDTLTKIVDHVRKLSPQSHQKINFMVTTNGVLLMKERLKFLVKENFIIDISLDGPEPEHNLFRVNVDGKGSFCDIFNNIKYIKENYPDYFKENVRIKITLHPKHDISAIEDFFLSNDDIFSKRNVFINQVVINEELEKEIKENWTKARKVQMEKIEELYDFDEHESWFLKKFFFESLQIRFESKGTPLLSRNLNFTGNCFPGGQRIFVDIYGRFLVCERGMEHFPIGNVNDGIDIETIKKIVSKWKREIIKRECWKCGYWHFCPMCFSRNKKGNHFLITDDDCKILRENVKKKLKRYIEQEEKNDEMFSDHHHTVIDFLDSLQPVNI